MPFIRPFALLTCAIALCACPQETTELAPQDGSIQPTYDQTLADLTVSLNKAMDYAHANPTDWTRHAEVAQGLQTRARLTGDLDDYASAQRWIESAFEAAPSGSGPWFTRASLNYTLHRIDPIAADLALAEQALLLDEPTFAKHALLRGNVAFQTGDYQSAFSYMEASAAGSPSVSLYASRAQLHWKLGDHEAAESDIDRAESMYFNPYPEPRVWFHLQRGLLDLDRGRYAEAAEHYEDADSQMPGHWLIQEHQAELLALQGHTEEALEQYHQIVDRTGHPEFMDAIAALLLEQGDEAESLLWQHAARTVYLNQLERFPEASYGHALDHFLTFGAHPEDTLELAQANAALRPNGEALTGLALAHFEAGHLSQAVATIERVLDTDWHTADTFAAASVIFSEANRETDAQWAAEQALAINPYAL